MKGQNSQQAFCTKAKAPEMTVLAQKLTTHKETSLPFLFSSLFGEDTQAVKNRNILQASETYVQEKAPVNMTE